MLSLDDLSELPIFTNSLTAWLTAASVAIGVFFLLLGLRGMVRRYHEKLRSTQRMEILEIPAQVLGRTTVLFFAILALYAGLQPLTIGPQSASLFDSAITIGLFWQAGIWAVAAASAWLTRKRQASLPTDKAIAGSLGIIGFIVNVIIWALVVLLTLDNLGVNITALVAGLGIGGVAVALALQNILGDLFASLSITLDRPFVLGDFLIVDDFLGSVEYIGIKSTRLRSLSGEQIIMSNGDLLKSRVRNYGRMSERRVVFATTLAYETPIEVIAQIPAVIKAIVEEQENTRFDRSHFQKHGASSIDFETVYYVLSADFNKYMDIQQSINIRLHRKVAELGAAFAYPMQRLLIQQAGDPRNRDSSTEGARRPAALS
jgi:small-conductance mechanosensitive channel